jgi:putative transposase
MRLSRDQYIGQRIYFVTICAERRRPIFKDTNRCTVAIDALRKISVSKKFLVHAYCLMPDHVHFLVEGQTPIPNLVNFIASWKQTTGYLFRNDLPSRFWQRRFHDYILRKANESEAIAWYIWLNPVRKNMVATPEQYPHSGSFTVEWPKVAIAPRAPSLHWLPPWKLMAGTRVKRAPTQE